MKIWPIKKSGARLVQVKPDHIGGELFISAVFDGGVERDLVYEGMYYTQLDERSAGLLITSVVEITPEQLKQSEHQSAAALFYEDCGMEDDELLDMYRKRYCLFVHRAEDGGEYIVLAQRRVFIAARPGGDPTTETEASE